MRSIERIILHRSLSKWGDTENITQWHTWPRQNKDGTVTYLGKTLEGIHQLPEDFQAVDSKGILRKQGNGWSRPGYHRIILNSYPTSDSFFDQKPLILADGRIEEMLPFATKGIHCRGYNSTSIAICLVGDTTFTSQQLYSLRHLVFQIRKTFGEDLPLIGHDELLAPPDPKVCPHIDMDFVRELVKFPLRRNPEHVV